MNDIEAKKLEVAIDLAGKAMLAAPTPEAQRACQDTFLKLIGMRPKATIERMESRKGLA